MLNKFLLVSIVNLGLGLCLLIAFGTKLWLLELLVSFMPLAIGAQVVLTALQVIVSIYIQTIKNIAMTAAAVMLVLFNLLFSLHVQPKPVTSSGQPTITFTTFNREFKNDDLTPASEYLKQQSNTVIALQETTPAVTQQISQATGLPYTYTSDRLNMVQNTGSALLSRYPIKESTTLTVSDKSSLVRVVISVPLHGDMAFYSLHLTGPFSSNRYQQRLVDNQTVVTLLANEHLPLVLGGDFNTTVFSPGVQDFNRDTAGMLRSTTPSSWPACSRFGNFSAATCLRIDHIYLPRSAQLTSTAISPPLGSDHRAVTIGVKLN